MIDAKTSKALARASVLLCLSASAASAQEAPLIQAAGVDGLPNRIRHATATKDGGLLLIPERVDGDEAPIVVIRHAGNSRFVMDTFSFDRRTFGSPVFEHAEQDREQTTWAVTGDQVMWRGPVGEWSLIRTGDQDKTACVAWQKFGTSCSFIAPIAKQRAILLRPKYGEVSGRRMLGSEVVALEQGTQDPLANIELPGIAVGPAVTDGQGGFWVMLRRTEQARNFKPLRGYLHYTSAGEWEMWSDSGEVVEGTTLMGRSGFLINPEPRKMAPDMKGGFFAIGKDDIVYHVDEKGESDAFSTMQPSCRDCRQLAIGFDGARSELHLLSAQWTNEPNRRQKFVRGLSYMRFDANGSRVFSEDVPLPSFIDGKKIETIKDVRIYAEGSNVWVLGRTFLLHRSRQGWRWLGETDSVGKWVEAEQAQLEAKQRAANANPELATAALYGYLGLTAASVLGAYVAVGSSPNGSSAGDTSNAPLYGWLAGSAVGLLPSMLYFPTVTMAPDDPMRQFYLIGAIGTPTLVALTNWGTSELTSSGAVWKQDQFQAAGLIGALGGAAVGFVGATFINELLAKNTPEAPDDLVLAYLGSMLTSGFASLGWALMVPKAATTTSPGMLSHPALMAPPPMLGGTTLNLRF